jgi:hypothetical protein
VDGSSSNAGVTVESASICCRSSALFLPNLEADFTFVGGGESGTRLASAGECFGESAPARPSSIVAASRAASFAGWSASSLDGVVSCPACALASSGWASCTSGNDGFNPSQENTDALGDAAVCDLSGTVRVISASLASRLAGPRGPTC